MKKEDELGGRAGAEVTRLSARMESLVLFGSWIVGRVMSLGQEVCH